MYIFGYLGLFLQHPGVYRVDLREGDERLFCKFLVRLALRENVRLDCTLDGVSASAYASFADVIR